jgi:gliding motility-associated-like protein
MNKKNNLLILLFLISNLFFCNLYSQTNLLTNGGFESGGSGTGFIVSPPYNFVPNTTTGMIPSQYTIATNTAGLNGTFTTGGDHTGGGNMLIVDSVGTPNTPFWSLGNTGGGICGLIPNSTYVFSYWIKGISTNNVSTDPGSTPIIAISVNGGAVATTLVSGNPTVNFLNDPINPGSVWTQVTYSFLVPASGCATISLINTATSPGGNDFAIDDLVFTPCTLPVAPTVTSPQVFCNTAAATVASLTATGTALQWYNVPTGGTALPTTTLLVTGNYYVSQTIAGCEGPRSIVGVTINATPSPTATTPQVFCNAATVANLTATGTALLWYDVATGGTALATSTPLATGNYYVSQTIGGCEGTRRLVAVTLNVTAAPTATSPQAFCNAATVANLVATGTALQWYNVATGGTVLTNTTPLATGNYYVSQTIAGCQGPRTLVAVTLNVTAAPTATTPQVFCNTATVANLTATGTALQWYNVATGGTALATTTLLTTGNYYVSQTIAGCEGPRSIVGVTINTTPAPTATTPQVFCNASTVANLTATGTALQWYDVATGGTALATSTPLATGNYYVSQTIGGCEGTRRLVAVTLNVTGAPTATSPQVFCNAATVANLTATGTALQWYNVATGGTVLTNTTPLATGNYYVSQTIAGCQGPRTLVAVTMNVTAAPTATTPQVFCNTATVTATVASLTATGTALQWYNVATGGTALATTTPLATGNYYVSQTIAGCESSRRLIAVTLNTIVAPTATSPQAFCNVATIANLTATGTALQWYNVATGGTALTTTTSLTSGDYYVSQTLSGCESPRILVTVTLNITPVPTATIPQIFCNATTATVANLTATGTALQWYNVATGGTALATTSSLISGNYYVSQTIAGCESSRVLVVVTLNVTPAPAATSPQVFCDTATLADLVATGTALQWYDMATGGIALANTTSLVDGTTYYASQTLNACESERTMVVVTVKPTVTPTFDPIPAICSINTVSLPTSSTNVPPITGTWDPPFDNTVNGTYTFIPDAGQCATTTTTIDFNVIEATFPDFEGYIVLCAGDTPPVLQNTSPNGITGTWLPSAIDNTKDGIYEFTPDAGQCAYNQIIYVIVNQLTLKSVECIVGEPFSGNNNITVIVTDSGDYEYSLDGGTPQSDNIFYDVAPGFHTITVSDVYGCSIPITKTVLILDYPKYFTPNSDGFHDTWNITGLSDQPDSKINIFDRFGKLIKQISPAGNGWDGTFNGQPLPSTDYWFTLSYIDINQSVPKDFKAHFSLKR